MEGAIDGATETVGTSVGAALHVGGGEADASE